MALTTLVPSSVIWTTLLGFATLSLASCGDSSGGSTNGDGGEAAMSGSSGPPSGGSPSQGGSATGGGGSPTGTGGTSSAGRGGTPQTGGDAGSGTGGEQTEAGGGAGESTGGLGGSAGEGADGGTGTSGASGSAGESGGEKGDGGEGGVGTAIRCTGEMPFFPMFDRSCATQADCVVVAHTTDCCGGQLMMAIHENVADDFAAAEAICDSQYPPCGCAAQWVDVEDGTQIAWGEEQNVVALCDGRSCRATYPGETFECGAARTCLETQYCEIGIGGPQGAMPSYTCRATDCADCECLDQTGCDCEEDGGHLTVTCNYP